MVTPHCWVCQTDHPPARPLGCGPECLHRPVATVQVWESLGGGVLKHVQDWEVEELLGNTVSEEHEYVLHLPERGELSSLMDMVTDRAIWLTTDGTTYHQPHRVVTEGDRVRVLANGVVRIRDASRDAWEAENLPQYTRDNPGHDTTVT